MASRETESSTRLVRHVYRTEDRTKVVREVHLSSSGYVVIEVLTPVDVRKPIQRRAHPYTFIGALLANWPEFTIEELGNA